MSKSPQLNPTTEESTHRENFIAPKPEHIPYQPFIHRVPAEVLVFIFLLLPNHYRDTFLSVCRGWKELVTNTGQFWTTLWVCPKKAIKSQEYLPRLKLLSKRSGSTLLDIVWHFSSDLTMAFKEELVEHLFQLAPLSRWKSLKVMDWTTHSQTVTNHFLSGGPIILQKVIIDEIWNCNGMLNILEQHANIMPLITHIELNGYSEVDMSRYPTLLGRITTLVAPTVNPAVMNLCRNLSTLHVGSLSSDMRNMPQVRTLRIGQQWFMANSFNRIHVPYLESLDVHHIDANQPVNFPCLRTLTIQAGEIWPLSFFRAEALVTLSVARPLSSLDHSRRIFLRFLAMREYKLRPSILILNTPVAFNLMALFLQKFPSVEKLAILVDPGLKNDKEKLIQIFTLIPENIGSVQANDCEKRQLCPNLTSLWLRLDWNQEDCEDWMNVSNLILDERSGGIVNGITCEWVDGNRITITRANGMGE